MPHEERLGHCVVVRSLITEYRFIVNLRSGYVGMAEKRLQPADVIAVGFLPERRGQMSHTVQCHPVRIHPGARRRPFQRLGRGRAANGFTARPPDVIAVGVYIVACWVGGDEQRFIIGRRAWPPRYCKILPDCVPYQGGGLCDVAPCRPWL